MFVRRFDYQPEVAIDKVKCTRPGSFESKAQEDRVYEFWERENSFGPIVEVVELEICDVESTDSSENEEWFIEEEIGDDIVEVYEEDDDDIFEVVHKDVETFYEDDVIEEFHDPHGEKYFEVVGQSDSSSDSD